MSLCPAAVRLLTDARHLRRSCSSWPACGGANGSIRFEPELNHGANAGLKKGVNFLKEFKEQFPLLSWADIIQLASAVAIECCGGPTLPMRYGRLDVSAPEQCPKEGNLPDAKPPFGGGARDAPSHLRAIFYRMGFSDREIVALSGAHTLGRTPPRPKPPLVRSYCATATCQPHAGGRGLLLARAAPRACVARGREPSAVARRAGRAGRAAGRAAAVAASPLPHGGSAGVTPTPTPNADPCPHPEQARSRSARA